ncbi:N-acetylmuramidase domain-containing protein [Chitiniphilus purpureus]|uniref:N-acetylmuramidase domain-containing protein n=1 Tax=Chitiniphilus purpureus TaxID=2981137 RepID=A0ABY6DQY7_9NEIS|nr:N-acetylmuramidase domain-containing protein [Chitiniphilus sp. CD1]UXY16732.1 N-acetylmuramidase domain-containing protein [Chitiniphilus sp. CD1]
MRVLRLGDTGVEVRELQQQLVRNGWQGKVDGWFGEATELAVRAAQQRYGLVVDGIAGPKTLETLKAGQRPLKLLTLQDLQRASEALGVPLASVQAVNEVESRGKGFLPDGRPVILFERHIMYRQLHAAGRDADALAQRYPAIVNTARGGYAGGATEHMRLGQAISIDADCALASASWGAFQIMGFHWQTLGYGTVQDFVRDMHDSEGHQLQAFVRFILADAALHKALKARKWADFARGYNGPAYKENLYDVKLARAYDRYAKVPA